MMGQDKINSSMIGLLIDIYQVKSAHTYMYKHKNKHKYPLDSCLTIETEPNSNRLDFFFLFTDFLNMF